MAALIYSAAMLLRTPSRPMSSRQGSALWLSLALVVYLGCTISAMNLLTIRSPIEGGTWEQIDNHWHWQHPQFSTDKPINLMWRIKAASEPLEQLGNSWVIASDHDIFSTIEDPSSNMIILGPERPLWQVIAGAWSQ